MSQRQGFGKIGVQSQRSRHGARDLRDFESMRETVAEVIGIACGENLRFCFEAAKRPGMNHAVAVARIVAAIRMRWLEVAPAA